MSDQVKWRGIGRWLSFAAAALLVVLSIPAFATDDASTGWNIFVGLLLFGFVASGHRRAPLMVGLITALTALRLMVALAGERNAIGAVAQAILLMLLFVAYQDLRKQTASFDSETPPLQTLTHRVRPRFVQPVESKDGALGVICRMCLAAFLLTGFAKFLLWDAMTQQSCVMHPSIVVWKGIHVCASPMQASLWRIGDIALVVLVIATIGSSLAIKARRARH